MPLLQSNGWGHGSGHPTGEPGLNHQGHNQDIATMTVPMALATGAGWTPSVPTAQGGSGRARGVNAPAAGSQACWEADNPLL